MKNNYISKVINRYFKEQHNKETELKVQKWLLDDEHKEEKKSALFDVWKGINNKPNADIYRSLSQVQQKLGMKRTSRRLWHNPFFRVAAILLPLVSALTIYMIEPKSIDIIEIATLTGEQKEITLPDGSTVLMNACSRITYPERFDGDLRAVQLSGEALFTVTRDTSKRFIVTTKDINVEVLGTQFNVKSYTEDNIASATLIVGSVEVGLKNKDYLLSPNQELIYNRSDDSHIIQNVSQTTLAWRDGVLMFDQMTIHEITKSLERQYNIKFQYATSDFLDDIYSVKFSNSDSIESIMDVMQDLVGSFSYNINNKIITLKKE